MTSRKRPRRAILEVLWGPMLGTKAALLPGESLRVGGSDRADLALLHDRKLSALHFEIRWDGQVCTVVDLRSHAGTSVDGQRVTSATIDDGGWIRAGQTDFSLHTEGSAGPRMDDDDLDEEDDGLPEWDRARRRRLSEEKARRERAAESALAVLRAEQAKEPLFAVLDAARDDRILELLRQAPETYRSLYEGIQGETLAEVAPYLVGPFREDSGLLDQLVCEGWGRRWGIWLTSRAPFRDVRRHLRRFLMVELEDRNEAVYFRFYDPWVWTTLWPSWSAGQKEDLSGGILTWLPMDQTEEAA